MIAAIWGVNFVTLEVGLRDFPPMLFAALRFLFVAFPAILFVGRPGVGWRWLVAAGLTMCLGQYALLYLGMRMGMPAGLSSLVLQVQALFTLGYAAVLLGESPTGRQLLGTGVAFAGIIVAAVDFGRAGSLGAFILCVAAAASWGLGNIATRRARPTRPTAFIVWISLVPPIPLLALSMIFEGRAAIGHSLTHPSWPGMLSLAYIVIMSTLVAFSRWSWLLARYGAGLVAGYSLLVPIFGVAAAYLMLDQRVRPWQYVAGALVLIGIALTSIPHRRLTPIIPQRTDHPQLANHPI